MKLKLVRLFIFPDPYKGLQRVPVWSVLPVPPLNPHTRLCTPNFPLCCVTLEVTSEIKRFIVDQSRTVESAPLLRHMQRCGGFMMWKCQSFKSRRQRQRSAEITGKRNTVKGKGSFWNDLNKNYVWQYIDKNILRDQFVLSWNHKVVTSKPQRSSI